MKDDRRLIIALIADADLVWLGLRSICSDWPRISLIRSSTVAALEGAIDLALLDPFAGATFDIENVDALVNHPRVHAVAAYTWTTDPLAANWLHAMGVDSMLSKGMAAANLPAELLRIGSGAAAGAEVSAAPSRSWHDQLNLSVREVEVLALVASGVTNKEIAQLKYLSMNTVKSYIRSAYRKIGVERRAQAILWATEHLGGRRSFEPMAVGAA